MGIVIKLSFFRTFNSDYFSFSNLFVYFLLFYTLFCHPFNGLLYRETNLFNKYLFNENFIIIYLSFDIEKKYNTVLY